MQDSTKRVLIDTCVYRYAHIAEYVTVDKAITWGEITFTTPITKICRKKDIFQNPTHAALVKQIEALPAIAKLAMEGRLELYTYSELNFENWHSHVGIKGIGYLLENVEIKVVKPAVERSRFQSMNIFDYIRIEGKKIYQ